MWWYAPHDVRVRMQLTLVCSTQVRCESAPQCSVPTTLAYSSWRVMMPGV